MSFLYLYYLCRRRSDRNKCWTLVYGIFVAFGGLFYYVGDNLPTLVRKYGSDMGLNPSVIDSLQINQPIFLMFAVALYRAIPLCIKKLSKPEEKDKNASHYVQIVELLAVMVEIDSWFTAAKITKSVNSDCPPATVIAFLALLSFFLIVLYVIILYGTVRSKD